MSKFISKQYLSYISRLIPYHDNHKQKLINPLFRNSNGALAPIKSEFANDLAAEMIEGTSYPRSELEWSFFEQSLWHVETYKSESEDGPDGF